jgi:hypothetical protein
MTLAKFEPTSRNILFSDVREEKVGSIFIPERETVFATPFAFDQSEVKTHEWKGEDSTFKVLQVIKVGKDCATIQPGDKIVLVQGAKGQPIELDGRTYLSVPEIQVIGYERG